MEDDEFSCATEKSFEIINSQAEYANELRHLLGTELTTRNSYESTVIFGQYEAGTGVIIDKKGIVLTCAHCLGDEPKINLVKVLILFDGRMCIAKSIHVDEKIDLSLLQITGFLNLNKVIDLSIDLDNFAFVALSPDEPVKNTEELYCIGQPGRDDLESKKKRKTSYPLINISTGRYRGVVKGDITDNEECGKLKHDCWTYWGHSGAPLISKKSGFLIGLHSSWDDFTGMRHGIHCSAIKYFLEKTGFNNTLKNGNDVIIKNKNKKNNNNKKNKNNINNNENYNTIHNDSSINNNINKCNSDGNEKMKKNNNSDINTGVIILNSEDDENCNLSIIKKKKLKNKNKNIERNIDNNQKLKIKKNKYKI
jgi:hypothetical protein